MWKLEFLGQPNNVTLQFWEEVNPEYFSQKRFRKLCLLKEAAAFASETAITLSCTTSNGSAVEGVLAAIEVEIPIQSLYISINAR